MGFLDLRNFFAKFQKKTQGNEPDFADESKIEPCEEDPCPSDGSSLVDPDRFDVDNE
ncbi:MAG: hypothetical protein NTW50_01965 [Candidatus Berkelbacteria bacterium]|nr:hypothetical protein [Candidatus Berkelbacteria bacterium]